MPVQSRIKIIQVNNLEEVETKVNDFLAFDNNIAHLVNIDYRLESNFVIIEYFVMPQQQQKEETEDNILFCNSSPLTYWWDLCFPFQRV
jgi:hypothetical protein